MPNFYKMKFVCDDDPSVFHTPDKTSPELLAIDAEAGLGLEVSNQAGWKIDKTYKSNAMPCKTIKLQCPTCSGPAVLWRLVRGYYYTQWFIVCDACQVAIHLPGTDG